MSNDQENKNKVLAQQLSTINTQFQKWKKELEGYKKWALENDGVVSAEEQAEIDRRQKDMDAILARVAQIVKAKGLLAFMGLPTKEETKATVETKEEAPMIAEVESKEELPMTTEIESKEGALTTTETTLERPDPLKSVAALDNEEAMAMLEEENGGGMVNIGNIEQFKKDTGYDVIAVVGVTPHDTIMESILLGNLQTFINVDLRLRENKGTIVLIAANSNSWEKTDFRMLATLTGLELKLNAPYKSKLWQQCEETIGKKQNFNLSELSIDLNDAEKVADRLDKTKKIEIVSDDGGFVDRYIFSDTCIDDFEQKMLSTKVFIDKTRFSEKTIIIGGRAYLIIDDLAPNRKYYVSTFNSKNNPILIKNELTGLTVARKFKIFVKKTMIENASVNNILNEGLSEVVITDDTQDGISPEMAEVNYIGFGFVLKPGGLITSGGNFLTAYDIVTAKGVATKVKVKIKKSDLVLSFEPYALVNAVLNAEIYSITYNFKLKKVSFKSNAKILHYAVSYNLEDFFQKVFSGVEIENIFNEKNIKEKSALIEHNFYQYMGGGSESAESSQSIDLLDIGVSLSGSILIKKNAFIKIGEWGGIYIGSGGELDLSINLASPSIMEIKDAPDKVKINQIELNASKIYVVANKKVQATINRIELSYGGEISLDIVIENKAYKKAKMFEAIVKAVGVCLFVRAAANSGPVILPNDGASRYIQAALDTQIIDGVSRFALEQTFRSLLIQNIKASNISLIEYGVDIQKALGL